jgi:hypothetical protein
MAWVARMWWKALLQHPHHGARARVCPEGMQKQCPLVSIIHVCRNHCCMHSEGCLQGCGGLPCPPALPLTHAPTHSPVHQLTHPPAYTGMMLCWSWPMPMQTSTPCKPRWPTARCMCSSCGVASWSWRCSTTQPPPQRQPQRRQQQQPTAAGTSHMMPVGGRGVVGGL